MYVENRVAGERIVCDSSEPKSIEELKEERYMKFRELGEFSE